VVVVTSVGLVMSISGCTVAARLITTAQAIHAVHEFVESESRSTDDISAASAVDGTSTTRARVTGAAKSGLRLNSSPGSGRLAVLPEGAIVFVLCRTEGRRVDGPNGPDSGWSSVVTTTGQRGYMSEAFLDFLADDSSVPRCPAG